MRKEPGAWRFYNVGQLEYMFLAEDESGSETQAERRVKEIQDLEEKKRFFLQNATKIREWPERIRREENLV